MTKEDISWLKERQKWTTITLFMLMACIWLMIMFDVIEQPQGTWECAEWEESDTVGYYKKILEPDMFVWMPERVCIKEQFVRVVE